MGTRLRPQKSGTPALSEPGLSAPFWSTVLSGAQIFFSTFFCVQNKKTPKRPNLSGQAGDTLTHLKALILIHNTSKKKWCLPPAWTSQPACQRDRPPFRREKLFFQT